MNELIERIGKQINAIAEIQKAQDELLAGILETQAEILEKLNNINLPTGDGYGVEE